jgi:hypothetical protein
MLSRGAAPLTPPGAALPIKLVMRAAVRNVSGELKARRRPAGTRKIAIDTETSCGCSQHVASATGSKETAAHALKNAKPSAKNQHYRGRNPWYILNESS